MLNIVTEMVGKAGAVLIRAVEPLEGIKSMARSRGVELEHATRRQLLNLTNGPAKLVLAMGIDGSLNGRMLGLPELGVFEGRKIKASEVVTTTRIGINVGKELPLRFYERGNPFVSKI